MDGKRRLVSGIILGALIGGATTLCNKEARGYAKYKLNRLKSDTTYYIKNPEQGASQLRAILNKWDDSVVSNVENTINAVEQVGETIDKITKK